jgi:hypothetical protein
MFFKGKLEIDPSKMTVIENVKPKNIFAKVISSISFGSLAEKQERETFTAMAILQQINMSLRSMNITNLVRLAVNDHDFYLDDKGEEDDLETGMIQTDVKLDPYESESFDGVFLVLEHVGNNLKYLIEIRITRVHKVGEYPIQIEVNGLMNDFQLKEGESRDDLANKMKPMFESQVAYDSLIKYRRSEFDQFVDKIELAIRKFITTDDVKKTIQNHMVRPKEKLENPSQIPVEHHSSPVFYGYYGFENILFYSFLWGSMAHSHNIYTNNFTMVDSHGNDVMSVGEEGFNAGESNTLNDEAPFEAPNEGDLSYSGENEFQEELQSSNLWDDGETDKVSDSWDFGDSDFGGGDDSGGCSSCGGCGGCD